MSSFYWKLFLKSLLLFITFLNVESAYLVKGFLHKLCQCFDVSFVQLWFITRARNKFAEIIAFVEYYYLIVSDAQNKESKRQLFWNVNETQKHYSLLIDSFTLLSVLNLFCLVAFAESKFEHFRIGFSSFIVLRFQALISTMLGIPEENLRPC